MATILLADNHAATRELLTERLSADGHTVIAADDHTEAFERFATTSPDLVIASVALPALDGRHLLARLRAAGPRVRLMVYDTGHQPPLHGIRAVLGLGANGYVADPTRHDDLREKVAELVGAERQPPEHDPADRVPPRRHTLKPSPPEPLSSGELGPTTVAEVLLSSRRERLTALLELEADEEEHTIRIEEGRLTGIRSSDPNVSLPRWMVGRGRIDEETAREAMEISARDGLSPAGALVAVGAVEADNALVELLHEHARDVISGWLALQEGRFRLMPDAVTQTGPSLDMDPLPLVREAASRQHPVGFWMSALGDRLDRYPFRTDAFREQLDYMALSPAETTMALKISGHVTARELLSHARDDLKGALLLLWFLDRTGAVAFSNTQRDDVAVGVYQSAPPPSRKKKPLPAEHGDALRDEALRIVTASYFGVLGVDITSDIEEIEEAYHRLATRFHPESWEEYDLGGLEDLLQTVLDRASAAYRVLSSEEKRKSYLEFLLSRHESPRRQVDIVPEAEIALRHGIDLLEAGDHAGAAAAFQEASDLNPKEPAFLAHLALARFREGHGPPEARAKQPRKLLKKALGTAPSHEQANMVAALIEDACGNRDAARAHALTVLRHNPSSETGRALLKRINRTS